MKKLILTAAALAVSGSMAWAQDTMRIATEGAYAPYNFINDSGDIDGFERELGDELCKRASLTCTWVKNDWDSIIPNLVSGNYDAIMAGMSINEERKKAIDFSTPYTPPSASSYMGLNADADINGVVAAQAGTIQASHVAETGATLVEFPTLEDAVASMVNGESDAVLADKDSLVPILNDSNGKYVWVGQDVTLDGGIGVGLRKSDTALKEKLDATIAAMQADGSLNAMIVKWFGEDSPKWN